MSGPTKKDKAAAALGRKGGRKGGKAKVPKGFSMLTPEERSKISKEAAAARWGKKPD